MFKHRELNTLIYQLATCILIKSCEKKPVTKVMHTHLKFVALNYISENLAITHFNRDIKLF